MNKKVNNNDKSLVGKADIMKASIFCFSQNVFQNSFFSLGSVFLNNSQEQSLSFSPRFVNLNATLYSSANLKLCYIQTLLKIELEMLEHGIAPQA